MASEDTCIVSVVSQDMSLEEREEPEDNKRCSSAEPLMMPKSDLDQERPRDTERMDIEKRIRNVLQTRPSIRMASRHKAAVPTAIEPTAFSRTDTTRHTLPTDTLQRVSGKSLPEETVRRRQLRKTSFLSSFSLGEGLPLQRRDVPDGEKEVTIPSSPEVALSLTGAESTQNGELSTSVTVQDFEARERVGSISSRRNTLTGKSTLERGNELRKSTLHLKHRMLKHRQTVELLEEHQAGIKTGCIAHWQYVRWPKVKSWLRVQFSRRLWKSHLKEVEGHFGSAVVSYFIFLRWLFIMNLLIFTLWFSIICIPQLIFSGGSNSTSQVSCVFEMLNENNYTCAGGAVETMVYSLQTNCTYDGIASFGVQTCSFNDDGIAVAESGSLVSVSGAALDTSCQEREDVLNLTTYILCPNVNPHIEWYIYIVDFISGTGIFNETILFHGDYPNIRLGRFRFDLAFIIMVGLIYAISVILLVYKMGHAFNESYVEFGKRRKVNFCNKLFTAWDFNITNPKTADLKKTHIKTDFQEELADIQAREKERTKKELALVIFIRIWTNLFVLLTLVGAGAAIYFSAVFVASEEGSSIPIISEYLSAIVISVLNAIYPFVFQLVARFEQYKTASASITITLVRTILVRLSSLLVLLASLYDVVSECTRVVSEDTDTSECTFSNLAGTFISNITDDTETCPPCWETFIGQQFYKLALTNLLVSLGATVLIESGRNFAAFVVKKIKNKHLSVLLPKVIKRGNFNIPRSILDLIYTQSLLWLGFLFSPLLPPIILLTSFCLFYVKKHSLLFNLDPDKKGFARSARTNFLFLFLMLLALFGSAVPVMYAVTQLKPSDTCGPFRGQSTMYESVTLLIESMSCPAQIAVDFFNSAAFVVPLVIFLLLLLYAMYITLRARDARFDLIKKQLVLEGANVTHIVGHLDAVLLQLANEKSKDSIDQLRRLSSQNPHYLDDLVKRYSKFPDQPHSSTIVDTTVV